MHNKKPNNSFDIIFDIIIIGGGLAGLTLACGMLDKLPNAKIALIEKNKINTQSNSKPNEKNRQTNNNYLQSRYIALSLNSKIILDNLKLWDNLNQKSTVIKNIEVSDQGGFGKTYLSAEKERLPALGYNITIQDLGSEIIRSLNNAKNKANLQIFDEHVLEDIDTDSNKTKLTLTNLSNNKNLDIIGKLIIATDGAESSVRKLLKISANTKSYNQSGLVTTIELKRPVSKDNMAFERFTKDGPLALLPCGPSHMSMVWACTPEQAQIFKNAPKKEFLQNLQENFGYKCGRFIDCGKRIIFPLNQTIMPEPSYNNILFLGNAAHTLHPVAGQGFNLSITEIMQLIDLIVEFGSDIGFDKTFNNPDALIAEFLAKTSRRKTRIINITDDLLALFSNNTPILKQIRRFTLNRIDNIKVVKTRLNQVMMGLK
jgi:2-octaprenyl-6-methoxyphenol hydroxylase